MSNGIPERQLQELVQAPPVPKPSTATAGGDEIGEPWRSAFGTSKQWCRSIGEPRSRLRH
jgi:hypothetical protein